MKRPDTRIPMLLLWSRTLAGRHFCGLSELALSMISFSLGAPIIRGPIIRGPIKDCPCGPAERRDFYLRFTARVKPVP